MYDILPAICKRADKPKGHCEKSISEQFYEGEIFYIREMIQHTAPLIERNATLIDYNDLRSH